MSVGCACDLKMKKKKNRIIERKYASAMVCKFEKFCHTSEGGKQKLTPQRRKKRGKHTDTTTTRYNSQERVGVTVMLRQDDARLKIETAEAQERLAIQHAFVRRIEVVATTRKRSSKPRTLAPLAISSTPSPQKTNKLLQRDATILSPSAIQLRSSSSVDNENLSRGADEPNDGEGRRSVVLLVSSPSDSPSAKPHRLLAPIDHGSSSSSRRRMTSPAEDGNEAALSIDSDPLKLSLSALREREEMRQKVVYNRQLVAERQRRERAEREAMDRTVSARVAISHDEAAMAVMSRLQEEIAKQVEVVKSLGCETKVNIPPQLRPLSTHHSEQNRTNSRQPSRSPPVGEEGHRNADGGTTPPPTRVASIGRADRLSPTFTHSSSSPVAALRSAANAAETEKAGKRTLLQLKEEINRLKRVQLATLQREEAREVERTNRRLELARGVDKSSSHLAQKVHHLVASEAAGSQALSKKERHRLQLLRLPPTVREVRPTVLSVLETEQSIDRSLKDSLTQWQKQRRTAIEDSLEYFHRKYAELQEEFLHRREQISLRLGHPVVGGLDHSSAGGEEETDGKQPPRAVVAAVQGRPTHQGRGLSQSPVRRQPTKQQQQQTKAVPKMKPSKSSSGGLTKPPRSSSPNGKHSLRQVLLSSLVKIPPSPWTVGFRAVLQLPGVGRRGNGSRASASSPAPSAEVHLAEHLDVPPSVEQSAPHTTSAGEGTATTMGEGPPSDASPQNVPPLLLRFDKTEDGDSFDANTVVDVESRDLALLSTVLSAVDVKEISLTGTATVRFSGAVFAQFVSIVLQHTSVTRCVLDPATVQFTSVGTQATPPILDEITQLVALKRELQLHQRGIAIAKAKLTKLATRDSEEWMWLPLYRRRAIQGLHWMLEWFQGVLMEWRLTIKHEERWYRQQLTTQFQAESIVALRNEETRAVGVSQLVRLERDEAEMRAALEAIAERSAQLFIKERITMKQSFRRMSRRSFMADTTQQQQRTSSIVVAAAPPLRLAKDPGSSSGEVHGVAVGVPPRERVVRLRENEEGLLPQQPPPLQQQGISEAAQQAIAESHEMQSEVSINNEDDVDETVVSQGSRTPKHLLAHTPTKQSTKQQQQAASPQHVFVEGPLLVGSPKHAPSVGDAFLVDTEQRNIHSSSTAVRPKQMWSSSSPPPSRQRVEV